MDTRQNMILDNQKKEVITSSIASCQLNPQTQKYDITFQNGKSYSYHSNRITWLKNPEVLQPGQYQIFCAGKEMSSISELYKFQSEGLNYWHICMENGTEWDGPETDLKIRKTCLDDTVSQNVLEYLRKIADCISLETEDGTKLLSKQYEKVSSFVDSRTALAAYLNPDHYHPAPLPESVPIFPFGCNASQYQAVKAALENRISVIQGPPGTGKTQTILNIIANLLIMGKTVQVVANNNSAVTNILEKLSLPPYQMDFLVAPLGNSKNKAAFLQNQTGVYPDLSAWENILPDKEQFNAEIRRRSKELDEVFRKQERLASVKQELQALTAEQRHFSQYAAETGGKTDSNTKIRKKLLSRQFMDLWQECQYFSDAERKLPFFFKLKSRLLYGISDWNFYKQDISRVITLMQSLFYQARAKELQAEIQSLEQSLNHRDAKKLTEEFTEISMKYLKSVLYQRYGNRDSRRVFSREDFWKATEDIQKEYPVVLSTAFSSRSSLYKHAQYDYLIMDEASQVDVASGALALSCAANAVIAGDTKQLPNVVTAETARKTNTIFRSFQIPEGYCFAKRSFLQSICDLLPTVPQTLLREHYRCHPQIINFCNQKFYGGELLIMSQDHGEKDVLSVVKTVVGDHQRGRMNQRQIDSIQKEILPVLSKSDEEIGIIAPYNDQVDALQTTLSETGIEIATVHKFQGREKEAIILTTVDDEISDFTDDPYLLNVAVSRAKKQLCLVVSGNEQPADSNIQDLISYIEYHNFSVTQSKIYSIFDYLYHQYTEKRLEFLKKHKQVSQYDSENLMYGLIQDILLEQKFLFLGVICHQPLNMLIHDTSLLNDVERQYAQNSATHLDFLIYNRVSKKPVLAVEVDGFQYHQTGTTQARRDIMKDHILELYEIPCLRFATNGSGEKEILTQKLQELIQNKTPIVKKGD